MKQLYVATNLPLWITACADGDLAGLLIGERVPMTRTNVAVPDGNETHRIFAFSYTTPVPPSTSSQSPTFVVAAVPEVRRKSRSTSVRLRGNSGLMRLARFR
jgi:hypothetical protein